MGKLKALLIVIEKYGDGFAPLAAVHRDLALLEQTLGIIGYEIEHCSPQELANASALDQKIRDFCSGGGPDDVRLVYFSGHGILADNVDCIVPALASRHAALVSPSQRVSTDLSKTVAAAKTGLVVFIIDACRNADDAPTTKGAGGWGDHARIARPDEHRFVRLFGCAASEVCQVISAEGEPPCSLFTRAFTDCLAAGDAVSLREVLVKVEARCVELLAGNPQLQAQTPRLSCGELSAQKHDVLDRPIFERLQPEGLQSAWRRFEPNQFHSLIILSEYETQHPSEWGLKDLVAEALSGDTGIRIWQSFRTACDGQKLLNGEQRTLPAVFAPSTMQTASLCVLDAFASWESFEKAIQMIVQADLAVFDVTRFEPGVMLLLGIRSAARRWLTVCSHGADWEEGVPLELPFGLQDLNINSHSPRRNLYGDDPVVDRFVQRVETGFSQVTSQPNYLDLPSYDALRQLGSNYSAASTIDPGDRILFLCSYAASYFKNWQFLSSSLKQALWKEKLKPRIERIIDYGTPQLIQHRLYEQIRRTAACIIDWSEFKASVFLELGVRLAVSEWGAIQLIDDRHLPGGRHASALAQIEGMRRLLGVIPYRYRGKGAAGIDEVVKVLLNRNPNLDSDLEYNRIHRTVLSVIGEIQAAQPPIVQQLKEQADALHHPEQGRRGAPQILFSGCREAKQDSECAARELRIAAWLYMAHRLGASQRKRQPEQLKTYQELGRSAANALYDLGDDESIKLAIYIEGKLREEGLQ